LIRFMKKNDRQTVLALIDATDMFTPEEIVIAEELIDAFLDQPDQKDYTVIVIENENNRVVGYLCYGPTPLTYGTYDLYWMAVSPQEQGRGYGKQLVHWLEEKVKEANGRLIVIETSSQPKYEPTRQFYLRLAYKEVARIADFYKPGDDRVIYVKHFD
jgi:GNAT superfamily N-acetyltransferase